MKAKRHAFCATQRRGLCRRHGTPIKKEGQRGFPVLPFLTDRIPIRPVPRYSFRPQEMMCFLIK
ncbi:hypothetical protein [Mesorhizobium japonicum]|uniref:Msr6922 protein n=1 Tax=Mesorhizobium japonicum (strain LMG 29417 / CECT 9101 / MAFF 303099) TaxID=266835 RepID=Q987T5_RHILO|nr:hypothetical protein [Mesorhizobium japonicum]BAB53115.1 msr6922 [Mesorhizobium japonicum MAFF 303099]